MSSSTAIPAPPLDGRQSDTARDIARGATRSLSALGFAAIPEFTLANGRRADIIAVSPRSDIWIVEIKSSLEDFRSDQKWHEYRDFCDRLFFAVMPDFPLDVLPADTGLILADRYGGEIARDAPAHALSASRRKSVLTSVAMTAAMRLADLHDPHAKQDARALT